MGMRYRFAIENHVRIHADRMRVKGWDPCLSANYAQAVNNPRPKAKRGDGFG